MKLRSLVLSAIISVTVSANIYAISGQGYKIISEKSSHSSGFISAGIEENKELVLKKRIAPDYVNAMSWAYNASGRPGDYIKIQGDHSVSITNDSSITKRYTYTYTLYCEDARSSYEKTVDIYPHGNFIDSSHTYAVLQKQSEGTFSIHAGTHISGGDEAFHEATAVVRVRK